jgi:RNA polymerase sigma-70 factor (family 1)
MNNGFSKNDFKSFFLNYFHTVVRFAVAYLQDESECQDIAQETFIRLYQSWPSIETEEQARSFMYTTARNLCISRIRHQTIEEQFVLTELEKTNPDEPDENFYSEVTYQETLRLLRKAIDVLPQQSRQIILLGLSGKNNNEVAEMLGISVNTVKTLKKGAYKSLRNSLGDLPEEMLLLLLVVLVSA